MGRKPSGRAGELRGEPEIVGGSSEEERVGDGRMAVQPEFLPLGKGAAVRTELVRVAGEPAGRSGKG